MRRLAAPLSLCVLALGACERREARAPAPASPPPAAAVFSHRLSGDVSGEYRSAPDAEGGTASLFIGQAAAFVRWEAGDRTAPPLLLTLTGPDGEARITPEAYVVTDDSVQMRGATPDGGVVEFQARLDQGALATARRNLGDQTPVLTGTVTVEGRRTAVSLSRWGGD